MGIEPTASVMGSTTVSRSSQHYIYKMLRIIIRSICSIRKFVDSHHSDVFARLHR